jgi:hypothetical protein
VVQSYNNNAIHNVTVTSKDSGPKGPGFGLSPGGVRWSFPLAAFCWSDGVVE